MKSLGVGIVLMVALFFSMPYHWYLRHLWKKDPEKSWKKARKYVSGFFRKELKISGCKIEARGMENIPKDVPVLFVGNHRSYFDILIAHETIGTPVGFVAKSEMRKIALLNHYMDDIGCIFINRDDIRQGMETIKQGTEFMKMGHSMVLFPEGTRNQKDTLLPFREGGYRMAEKSGAQIVPMAISGSDLLLESAPKKRIRSHSVIIEFGKPFNPSEMSLKDRKAQYAQLPAIIQEMRDKHNIKN